MPRRTVLTLGLAVIAFAQTMAYYVYLLGDPGNYNNAGAQGDQVAYIGLAQQILHGRWDGLMHYTPGLPLTIAVGQLVVGDPGLGIALLQALVFAGVVVGVARLSAGVFGEHTAVWSAAAVALNPAIGFYAAQALTEFLTGAMLVAIGAAVVAWARRPRPALAIVVGLLVGIAGYLRSEYLGLALVFALVLLVLRRSAIVHALLVVGVAALVVLPWVARYTVVTGRPSLYNESPVSNLILMGTWFRVFDEVTFAELQRIQSQPGPREDAIAAARTVGPRPELSARYMEQVRGPYELPLGETLSIAAGNIQLNLRQYLINHAVLAPVLIWAGHTPVRAADAPNVPSSVRYAIWAAELVLLALALWQAALALRRTVVERALALVTLGVILFLTVVHILIAVDSRFTTPALPLIGLLAGARLGQLVQTPQRLALRFAARA